MPTVTEISNAPLWASLAFIIILLISLIAVTINRSDKRDLTVINDLRSEVDTLAGELKTVKEIATNSFERAVVAEEAIKYVRKEVVVLQTENASLKSLLTRSQARIIQVVNVVIGLGGTVPPEATLEVQTDAVADIPKPEGAEPLSGDIDKAVDTNAVESTVEVSAEQEGDRI